LDLVQGPNRALSSNRCSSPDLPTFAIILVGDGDPLEQSASPRAGAGIGAHAHAARAQTNRFRA